MRLDRTNKFYLLQAIDIAHRAGMECLIINHSADRQMIRARGKFGAHYLLSEKAVPEIAGVMGIRRLALLRSRISALGGFDDFEVDIEHNKPGEVSRIILSTKRSKVEFQCTNPLLLPDCVSEVDDEDRAFVDLRLGDIEAINKMVKSMDSPLTEFRSADGVFGVTTEDAMGDKFDSELDTVPHYEIDADFSFKYPSKILLSILKIASMGKDENREDEFVPIMFTEHGLLQIYVGETRFIVPQQIQMTDDDEGDSEYF